MQLRSLVSLFSFLAGRAGVGAGPYESHVRRTSRRLGLQLFGGRV
jgi:hypothetical protein